jgi:hypothetical protein
MSLLGNNVFANPTTPIWGQGGSNLPTDPTFNTVTFTPSGSPPYESTTIGTFSTTGVQSSTICILNGSNQLGPLCATALYAGVEQDYPRVIYQSDGIDYQAADSTSYFLAQVNSGSNGWDLSNISTINGSNYPPGGGGSYPRDASFNSIRIDPSGVPTLSIGTGTGGTVMGIRREEDGKEEDYITFAPTASEMALTNLVSINGAPVPLTVTDFAQSTLFIPLPTTPTPLTGLTFTAPVDGKLFIQGVGTFQSTTTNRTQVGFSFDVNGTNITSSSVIAACASNAEFTEVVVPTITQFPVTGGTVYDISAIALVAGGTTADWNATNVQLYYSFTTL